MQIQILIYSPIISPRLDYCVRYIFNEILGLEPEITSSLEDFKMFTGPKINYSKVDVDSSLKITPSGLLFENIIMKQLIGIGSWEKLPVFFITSHKQEINFDLFSAVFYMLSRYEEYLPYAPDEYGRFQGITSLAFRNGFLEIPVVDQWINKLGSLLAGKFPGLVTGRKEFDWLSSIDVDTAWAFLNRHTLHTVLSLIKSCIKGKDFDTRLKVLRRIEIDPFYTFDFLGNIHVNEPEKLMFFFLSGQPGGIDRNINPENPAWQKLVKDISPRFLTGIHPSFKAYHDLKILRKEIRTLSSLVAGPVCHSRQHYLMLNFPSTYRNLLESGVRNDYSMGFADHCGFRAGTSRPFNFYDLEKEEKTELRIWPFAVMDRTLKNYMKLKPEESGKKIYELIEKVHSSDGIFISLWHNDALGNYGEWEGWRKIYTDMIDYLRNRNS